MKTTNQPLSVVNGSSTHVSETTLQRDPPTLQLHDFENMQRRLNARVMSKLGATSPSTSSRFYIWLGRSASRFLLGTTDVDRLI